jgi:hypothetical protein
MEAPSSFEGGEYRRRGRFFCGLWRGFYRVPIRIESDRLAVNDLTLLRERKQNGLASRGPRRLQLDRRQARVYIRRRRGPTGALLAERIEPSAAELASQLVNRQTRGLHQPFDRTAITSGDVGDPTLGLVIVNAPRPTLAGIAHIGRPSGVEPRQTDEILNLFLALTLRWLLEIELALTQDCSQGGARRIVFTHGLSLAPLARAHHRFCCTIITSASNRKFSSGVGRCRSDEVSPT